MQEQEFQIQIKRLQSRWGERIYEKELVAILWRAFHEIEARIFISACDDVIGNMRHAPMFKDLDDAIHLAKSRAQEAITRGGSGHLYSIIKEAQRANKRADPEYVKACMSLLQDRLNNKITYPQFLEGTELLRIAAEELNPKTVTPGKDEKTRGHTSREFYNE
jgi:hypothetical protein